MIGSVQRVTKSTGETCYLVYIDGKWRSGKELGVELQEALLVSPKARQELEARLGNRVQTGRKTDEMKLLELLKVLVAKTEVRALIRVQDGLTKRGKMLLAGLLCSVVLGFVNKKIRPLVYVMLGGFLGFGGSMLTVQGELKTAMGKVPEDGTFNPEDPSCTSEKDMKRAEKLILASQQKQQQQRQEQHQQESGEENEEEEALLLKLVDEMNESLDHYKALETCQQHIETKQRGVGSFEVMWRLAREAYMASELRRKEVDSLVDPKRLELLELAVETTEELVERFPDQAISHKYHAICAQEISNHKGTKEKIVAGNLFQEHTLRAIELEPNDPTLHYMLGRFNFEVAKLSWAERMAARAIFGKDPPAATYQDALKSFELSMELQKQQERNSTIPQEVQIGLCHVQLKDKQKAKQVLQKVVASASDPSANHDLHDIDAIEQAKTVLNSL